MSKVRLNYTDVSSNIIEGIQEEIKKFDCNIVLVSRLSCSPEDKHLYIVMVESVNGKNEFTVWSYNAELESINHGHYNLNFHQAIGVFQDKIFII